MKVIPFLVVLLLLSGSLCFGQGSFKYGYIVLNSGDTLKGEIENSNWVHNPVTVHFRNGTIQQKYDVPLLKAFEITGVARYERFNVTYQETADDLAEATETFEGPFVKKELWLRLLYQEKYSLYELSTPRRKYFFVHSAKDGVRELVYRVKLSSNNQLQKDEQYKNMLLQYATENNTAEAVEKQLPATGYRNKDLLKLFSLLNNGKKGFEDTKKNHTAFDITLGATSASFKTSGGIFNDGSAAYAVHTSTFKSTVGFLAGIGVTFYSNGAGSKFQPRAGLNLRTLSLDGVNNNRDGSYQKEKYDGTLLVAEPNINLLFNLSRNEKTRILFGPYFGYNLVLSGNVDSRFENPGIVVNRKDFPPSNGGYLSGGADLSFIGAWGKINIHYTKSSNIFDSPSTILKASSITIGYGYIFKSNKKS